MSLSKTIEDLDFEISKFLFLSCRSAIRELSSFFERIDLISDASLFSFKLRIDVSDFPSLLKTEISQI